jgi:hypothetical protein
MGHPTLSFEEVRQRNEEIVAYSNQHPEITSTSLAVKYGLSRADRAKCALGSKGPTLGFRGH